MKPMVETDPHDEIAAASRIDERRQLIATAGAGLLYQHVATRLECFDAQRSESIVRRADDRELDALSSERVSGRGRDDRGDPQLGGELLRARGVRVVQRDHWSTEIDNCAGALASDEPAADDRDSDHGAARASGRSSTHGSATR